MKKGRTPRRKLKNVGLWTVLMAVFITELLVSTWCRVQCTQIGYEINRAAELRQKQVTLQNNLKIELARLKSPERIAGIAQRQLGLTIPKPEQVVVLP
jgi:cell division protein FtsL